MRTPKNKYLVRVRAGFHLGFLACIAAVLVAWSSLGVPKTPSRATPLLPLSSESLERPLYVHDGGLVLEFPTKAGTIHQALNQAGLVLRLGDLTTPELSRPVTPGSHVYVDRAKDVTLLADGEERDLRTRAATVGEVLRQADFALGVLDRLDPEIDAPVPPGLRVQVTRVRVEREVGMEVLPYQTLYQPDEDLEIGHERQTEPGAAGVYRWEHLTWYEDGVETQRVLEKEYLERPPRPRVVSYGTKIIPHYVETGAGSFQYYRTVRVYATWYSPRSAGKPPWHPGYGITSVGVRVHKGIIAVDPRVIPYWTQIYVPGYGVGVAADTGGGIVGNKIDLGFADHEPSDWRTGWVDIYLLGSPPPPRPPR